MNNDNQWMIKVVSPEETKYFKQDNKEDAWKAWRLMQDAFAWSSRETERDFTLTLLDQNGKRVELVVWDGEWRNAMDEYDRLEKKHRAMKRRMARRRGER